MTGNPIAIVVAAVVALLLGAMVAVWQALPVLIVIGAIAVVIVLVVVVITVWRSIGFLPGLIGVSVILIATSFYWWPMVSPLLWRLMAQPSVDQMLKRADYLPEFDHFEPRPGVVRRIREDLSQVPRDWSRPVSSENPGIVASTYGDLTRSEIGSLMRILCDDFHVLSNGPPWAEESKDMCSRSDYELGQLSNKMTLVMAQLARDQFEQTLCEHGSKQYCDDQRPNVFKQPRDAPPGQHENK